MIIGINGKIGSGKDTVGKIIQGLIVAKKHNIQNPSFEWIEKYYINSTWEIKKFAGKLKTIASLLTGVPVEKFEDQEFKQKHMGLQWKMTYREFLQKLGTEAMRDGLHTNVWVNALFADYKYEIHRSEVPTRAAGFIDQHVYPNWIITDMRFPNEMEAVEEREGITIRVHRDLHNGNAHISLIPHESETALDDAKFDYEIINDGTIEDLVERVREILIKEEII